MTVYVTEKTNGFRNLVKLEFITNKHNPNIFIEISSDKELANLKKTIDRVVDYNKTANTRHADALELQAKELRNK